MARPIERSEETRLRVMELRRQFPDISIRQLGRMIDPANPGRGRETARRILRAEGWQAEPASKEKRQRNRALVLLSRVVSLTEVGRLAQLSTERARQIVERHRLRTERRPDEHRTNPRK